MRFTERLALVSYGFFVQRGRLLMHLPALGHGRAVRTRRGSRRDDRHSNWECPIGQFRETCTSGSDSYCKLCTNKPGGSPETMYTSPGNSTSVNDGSGNDCAFQTCVNDVSSAQPSCPGTVSPEFEGSSQSGNPLKESDPANLVFYSEMPVDVATFIGSLSTEYKAAIAEVGTSSPTHTHNAHEIR